MEQFPPLLRHHLNCNRDKWREDLPTSQILLSHTRHVTFSSPSLPCFWMVWWVFGPAQVSSWEQAWRVLVTWCQQGPARASGRRSPLVQEGLLPTRSASSSARPIADARSPSDFPIRAPSPEGRRVNVWSSVVKTVSASFSLLFQLYQLHDKLINVNLHLIFQHSTALYFIHVWRYSFQLAGFSFFR